MTVEDDADRRAHAPQPGRAAESSLVGRRRELEEVSAAIDAAEHGRGQLFLLEGEAGIGKTHLADAIAERARRRGFAVLWGRCWEQGGAPAYWPWTQVVRALVRRGLVGAAQADADTVQNLHSILPDLPTSPAADAGATEPPLRQFAVFDAVSTLLQEAALEQPLLLVLDDLHAADHDSLRLLRFLAGELRRSRVVVLGTARDEPSTAGSTGVSLAESASDGRLLPLRGLSEEHVATMVERIAGEQPPIEVVRTVHRATGGNPLHIDSITHLLIAEQRLQPPGAVGDGPGDAALPLPQSIREATRLRLLYLDGDVRSLLRTASVIGRSFTLGVLAAVAEHPPEVLLEPLDTAVDGGTLRVDGNIGGSYQFEHVLVRDALYRELEPRRRSELHGRVAATLEQAYADDLDSHAAELAHHFHLAIGPAGNAEPAVAYSTRAGARAMTQTAYAEAANHYRRALDTFVATMTGDAARRCDLLMAIGAARTRNGDTVAGRAVYLEAATLAEQHGLDDRLAAAAIGYAGSTGYHFSGRRDETLVTLLEHGLAALPAGDSEMRARLLARLSVALYWSDLDGRRFELSEEAVAMARRLRGPSTLAVAIHSRRYAQWGPDDFEQRLADAAQCLSLALEANELELAVSARRWRFTDLLEDGDLTAADQELDAHAQLADQLRQPVHLTHATQFGALRAIMQGRFDEGEALADDARRQAERAGNALAGTVHGMQVLPVWWQQQRHEELDRFLRTALRAAPPHPATTSTMALIHLELGEREVAAAMVRQLAAAGFTKFRRDMLFLPGLAHLTLAAAELGAADLAEEMYDLLRAYAGRIVVIGAPAQSCWGAVDHYLGILAALGGQDDWAVDHFDAALAIGTRLGAPGLLAATRAELGLLLLRRRGTGRDRALPLLTAARRTAGALGITRLVVGLDAVLGADVPTTGRPGSAARPAAAVAECALRLDGDFWTVVTPRGEVHVRDAKGMQHLATLLARPRRRLHVLDLVGPTTGASGVTVATDLAALDDLGHGFVSGFGDGGEVLDATAKDAYRRRLVELEELIAEAERFNDIGRASLLGEERDLLVDELAAAVGLGGRDRRAVSVNERARVNVTRAIRSAIRRIGELDPVAGRHLDATVVTGAFCVYDPDRAG